MSSFGGVLRSPNALVETLLLTKRLERELKSTEMTALFDLDGPNAVRAVGDCSKLADQMAICTEPWSRTLLGFVGRAEAGFPTEADIPPCLSSEETVVVVHAGFVDNIRPITSLLLERRHATGSGIQASIIANLIETVTSSALTTAEVADKIYGCLSEVEGENAFLVRHASSPHTIFLFHRSHPIYIGMDEGGSMSFTTCEASLSALTTMTLAPNQLFSLRLDRAGFKQWPTPSSAVITSITDATLTSMHVFAIPQILQEFLAKRITNDGHFSIGRGVFKSRLNRLYAFACGTELDGCRAGADLVFRLCYTPTVVLDRKDKTIIDSSIAEDTLWVDFMGLDSVPSISGLTIVTNNIKGLAIAATQRLIAARLGSRGIGPIHGFMIAYSSFILFAAVHGFSVLERDGVARNIQASPVYCACAISHMRPSVVALAGHLRRSNYPLWLVGQRGMIADSLRAMAKILRCTTGHAAIACDEHETDTLWPVRRPDSAVVVFGFENGPRLSSLKSCIKNRVAPHVGSVFVVTDGSAASWADQTSSDHLIPVPACPLATIPLCITAFAQLLIYEYMTLDSTGPV